MILHAVTNIKSESKCAYPRTLEYFSLTNEILENGNIRTCSAILLAAFHSAERIQPEKMIKVSLNNIRDSKNNYYYTDAEFFSRNVFTLMILIFMDILVKLMGQRGFTVKKSS